MKTALLSLLLVACTYHSHRTIVAPNGRPAYAIHCPGNQAGCMEEAGSLCPRGYDPLEGPGIPAATKSDMTIQCRVSSPAAPPAAAAAAP